MIVAFVLPHRTTLGGIVDAAETAVNRGAEALVIAEAPLGRWASAPQAAAFLATRVNVPVGVALDGRARHPLHLGADISILQRMLPKSPFFIINGVDAQDLDPLKKALETVTPPQLPFASSIWILSEGRDATRAIASRGFMPLSKGPDANDETRAIWIDTEDLSALWDLEHSFPLCVLSTHSSDDVHLAPADLTRLKYRTEACDRWLEIEDSGGAR